MVAGLAVAHQVAAFLAEREQVLSVRPADGAVVPPGPGKRGTSGAEDIQGSPATSGASLKAPAAGGIGLAEESGRGWSEP